MLKFLAPVLVALALVGCQKKPTAQEYEVGQADAIPALTAEENAYIANNTIRVGFPERSIPLAFKDAKGQPAGVALGFAKLVFKKVGLKVVWVSYPTQALNIEAFKRREIDVAPHVKDVPERHQFMNFTQPYMISNVIMLIHEPPIEFPMTVGYAAKFAIQGTLERKGAQVKIIPFPTDDDSMQALIAGKIGAMVVDVYAADFLENKYKQKFIRSNVDFTYDLGMGFQKDKALLGSILSKGIANITSSERAQVLADNTPKYN